MSIEPREYQSTQNANSVNGRGQKLFVTVGQQMPFDRLTRTVDEWAGGRGDIDAFAQIGRGGWRPRNMNWSETLAPAEFGEHLASSDLVVAHAGMGTIILALESRKPLLVMPRREHLRETRSDHQVATARRFGDQISVAMDELELVAALDGLGLTQCPPSHAGAASSRLIDRIRRFIAEG